jgi:hypothetical protein
VRVVECLNPQAGLERGRLGVAIQRSGVVQVDAGACLRPRARNQRFCRVGFSANSVAGRTEHCTVLLHWYSFGDEFSDVKCAHTASVIIQPTTDLHQATGIIRDDHFGAC